MSNLLVRFIALLLALSPVLAAAPISAQPNSHLPDWLSLNFEQQSRMQHLDGQFRAGLSGSDQGFEMRNLLKAEATSKSFSVTAEFADMRTYLADSGTPLDSFTNNPLDILQANVTVPFSSILSDCLLYTSPSPRDGLLSRMPSSA